MKIGIEHAIRALHPDAQFTMVDDDITEWHSSGITQPTEDEINAKIVELTDAEPYRLLREERNRRLQETDWRASSDLTISDDWKSYRQALRDLPKTHPINYGDPKLDSNGNLDMSLITWPTLPS
tara:strand:+ start:235 stop:606 length:372 start_codon:yes stop_codon:yes gene_type:complete